MKVMIFDSRTAICIFSVVVLFLVWPIIDRYSTISADEVCFRTEVLQAATAILADQTQSESQATVRIDNKPLLPSHGTVAGFWFFAENEDSQLALMGHPPRRAEVSLDSGHEISIRMPVGRLAAKAEIVISATHLDGESAEVALRIESTNDEVAPISESARINGEKKTDIRLMINRPVQAAVLVIAIKAMQAKTSIRLDDPRIIREGGSFDLAWKPKCRPYPQPDGVSCSVDFRPAIENALIEWDWRMQDGIDTPSEPRSYALAIETAIMRGDKLLRDLALTDDSLAKDWDRLRSRYQSLQKDSETSILQWESLWLDVHRLKRKIALTGSLTDVGPLLFVKRVPSVMSHQLTQYYGYTAQPGGGLFVLPQPGGSMHVRCLATSLPKGSYLHPEVSFDGGRIYFAFCPCETAPDCWGDQKCYDRYYNLYRVNSDGSELTRLTDDRYDDFSPTCLPGGKLLFVSTRRGGYHRCGRGPCYVYTMAIMDEDDHNPRVVSFHETNEWDPAVLNDGRVIYTRWDYVDRNAVFYQQLWTVRQDGSNPRIFYGNNTFNPVGTWEARPIPGSNKLMATAAAHHGMTAGSIVMIDRSRGVDGLEPITRLTPDVPFPESELSLMRGKTVDQPTQFDDAPGAGWGPHGHEVAKDRQTNEERRWPGHCYRSPYPLSEKYFLAAYSFDRQRGEPGTNLPNMFGLYLCDTFGNKELLYRDPHISSQWPIPLQSRRRPPVLEMPPLQISESSEPAEGTFFLKNIYESWPKLPDVQIRRLRIVQVLPKTTPNINNPRVGAANASPGKLVLGTVPVEEDGSAYFTVPARIPVHFQALDARGQAVQTMRSLTYLQPGETVSCIGCHERRDSTVIEPMAPIATTRSPSKITPGPDGSCPLSFPILVQPVLDRHCIECHNAEKTEGNVVLTGQPAGSFSQSYNALVSLVAYSAWGLPGNNHEPLTPPETFGARASKLTKLLDDGHYKVKLSDEEWERIVTWMDTNALFYGTFNREDQLKQLRGERIAGPDLQ